ncbi:MAG: XdhC family protein [Chloroflexi bacterium]|nr:XdhC family protein [Chloroflexota bacterium]
MKQIFQAITDALDKGETIAVLTVVQASGSTPRHLSSNMLVRADGTFVGSIGGGTMEWQAIQDARDAITTRQARLFEYNLVGKTPGTLGMCGGTEQVFIDVLAPDRG